MSFSSENRTTRKEAQVPGAAKRPTDKGSETDDDALSGAEVAGYLVEMIGELAIMARARRLGNVAYLLELARTEAALAEQRDD